MIAVLTGDIINSKKAEASKWLEQLKKVLNKYGSNPERWEIYRGDSFQLALAPKEALWAALHIKAAIKQNKQLDVRIAIGLGDDKHQAAKISEANGSAYVRSGEQFEALKKQNLAINSADEHLNTILNLMLKLALLTFNKWSATVASIICTIIENPKYNQTDIANLLNRTQSSISEGLIRGGYNELVVLNLYYRNEILKRSH
ncbi:hypothetical protein GCM10027429_26270 [Marivirga atlantica]|jgi:hypothetical protein|uniref:Transcriptional regulator n=1 Tax=Marivirga atlantica TaxID=1548457 RepID=A0A937AP28_9BACT|nr:SatD family protein [Marivirga atlantica]MBL0766227.1 transcriptional regulator [Marivirga atlantica]